MKEIIGKRIKDVRPMTIEEADEEAWNLCPGNIPPVIVLEDDTRIYPSADCEGNSQGQLFGRTKKGRTFRVVVLQQLVGK